MNNKIVLEVSLREAIIISNALASWLPIEKEDEMISFMLFSRVKHKIEESTGKNESL